MSLLVGPGLPTLRIVSLAASLGAAALVGAFVSRESGRSVYGWIAAGIFLGTWRASGLYFDVARLDSLFTFLVLAGAYVLRFQVRPAGLLCATALAFLAVMTKQTAAAIFAPLALWCFWADWREHGRDLRAIGDWQRVLFFSLPLLVLVLGGLLWLQLRESHFLVYLLAVQAGHAIKWGMIGWFFWHDLLLTLPVVSIAVGVWLGLGASSRLAPSRDEQAVNAFHWVALTGVVLAVLVPRIKVGGALNNLILVHAWLSVCLGIAVARILAWVEIARPEWRARFGVGLAALLLVQLLVLVRVPRGWLPTESDLQAGRALTEQIAAVEGEVLMPVQGHIAGSLGKRVFAHQMPVYDYAQSGLPNVASLRSSYRKAIRERRFAAIVPSNTLFLESFVGKGLLEEHYRLAGRPFGKGKALIPISGAPVRVGALWLPRD